MKLLTFLTLTLLLATSTLTAQQKGRPGGGGSPFAEMERQSLAEEFKGLTTDGDVVKGLFPIHSTGVSTEPVRKAALSFLDGLTEEQQTRTRFPVDSDEWRKWANQHSYVRQGVSFEELTEIQRELGFALLDAGLSARGLQTTRDIMKLNETLAELKNDWDGYGEWKYHLTVMGEPSDTEPWGWQFDGHHAVINYFVLGDQVVMSPVFLGSEPVKAESGKYKGTIIMQEEQDTGLAFMRSLSRAEQEEARIRGEKGPADTLAEAFHDNLIVPNAGIQASNLDEVGQKGLLELIRVFVDHQEKDQAVIRMEEVKAHLDDTWFAWIGETEDDSVFYFRIQSPVIFIEFDHQRPIGLERTGIPTRNHIHSVIRTPNGNDYGKSLLQQHYEEHHKEGGNQ